MGYWLLVIGFWLRVIEYWLCVIDYWLLVRVLDHCLLVIAHWLLIPRHGLGSHEMSCDPKTCPEITGHISCSDIISTENATCAHCAAIFRTGAILTLASWKRERGGEGGFSNCFPGLGQPAIEQVND